jgi:hypothetical protein
MQGQTFYSDNDSGTMADIFKAVGLAEVLAAWLKALGREPAPLWIEEQGPHVLIRLPSSLDPHSIIAVQHAFLAGRARLLLGKHLDEKISLAHVPGAGFPYEELQAKRALYFERLKVLTPDERTRFYTHPEAEAFAALRELTPHPDLRFYAYINQMKGLCCKK